MVVGVGVLVGVCVDVIVGVGVIIGVADGVGVGYPQMIPISNPSQALIGSALDIQIDCPNVNVYAPTTPAQVVPEIYIEPPLGSLWVY